MKTGGKGIVSTLVIFCFMFPQLAMASAPAPMCGDEGGIADMWLFEGLFSRNPVISRINEDFELFQVGKGVCFENGIGHLYLYYNLPSNFSSYGISYSDKLHLDFHVDGSVDMIYGYDRENLSYDGAIGYFKGRINEIESNPRAREFILRMGPDKVALTNTNARIEAGDNHIEFNQYYNYVRGFSFPSSMEWENYPEIGMSHDIIERELLVGELSRCKIGKEGHHSYTLSQWRQNEGTFFITVALQCPSGWQDAFIRMEPDGSYDRLEISTDDSATGGGSNLFSANPLFGYIAFIISIIMIAILATLFKKKFS